MIDTSLPYCVYRTSHPEGFYYIGKSQTAKILSGEYIGSGVKLNLTLEKPGFTPDTWTTSLIETFATEDQAYAAESELVTVDTLTDPFCMNMAEGGERGRSFTSLAKSRMVPNNHSVASSPSDIKIGDIVIRVDSQGRYCLNDLHKAAGNHPRHAPSQFLRLDEVKDLVEFLVQQGINFNSVAMQSKNSNYIKPVDSVSGRYGGTYVVKHMVYRYAMWVSPEFSFKVISTYDQVINQKIESLTVTEETKSVTNQERAVQLITDSIQIGNLFGLSSAESGLKIAPKVRKETSIDILPLVRLALKK